MKLPTGSLESSWVQEIKETKEAWIERIDFDIVDFPVITGVPKEEGTEKMSFSTFGRLKRMAEIVKDNNNRFKTVTDVVRAAFYLGMTILYRMTELKSESAHFADSLYEHLKRNETFYQRNIILDDVILEINRLATMRDKGYITGADLQGAIDGMIAATPEKLQAQVNDTIKRVMATKYDKDGKATVFDMLGNHTRKNQMSGGG
jgi:hypothetical protein